VKRLWVISWVLMFAASLARGDFVIYRENFNAYAEGTNLTDLPGWYLWGGGIPSVRDGKANIYGSSDVLLNTTDIFSYGNTAARIEFDLLSYQQDTILFGPGSAEGLNLVYSSALGFQHGANRLYHYNGAYDYTSQVMNVPGVLGPSHWVFNVTKSDNQYTWNATYDGNPLLLQGSHTLTLNDSRGLNTMEWELLGGAGSTLDNIVITAIGVAKPKQTTVIIVR
jgi:hypothetical protein